MTKQDRTDLKLEIRARKEVLRRLDTPIRRLEEKVQREKTDRAVRRQALATYQTEHEIREAYGYEMITEEEMHQLLEELESGRRYVEETPTANSVALHLLQEFSSHHHRVIQSLEFELLPEKEQQRILREREERLAKAKARKEGLNHESHP